MEPAFAAYVSRWRIGLLVIGALGFVAAGIFMLRDPKDLFIVAIGWAGILFFGLCAIVGARQLFRFAPVMEVDARGVRWRRWSNDLIPWSAMSRIEVQGAGLGSFVCLWLHEPELYRSRHLMGWLAGANKAMGFGDIPLNIMGTDRRFDDLVEAFDRFAPKRRRRGRGRPARPA
ncbi:MAG: hypothetical protein JWN66_2766 [Sphingomonas bacterium]|uniref:STM3941 family protein n=1 Tax=Sphingomonas bacterium TaxID=1895847 RepID=UPI0026101B57|nr:STM3941 family protein [Sphingomonas bacterium]MDB5705650.1 hypothetical protein [Sphingomonas bacterium]